MCRAFSIEHTISQSIVQPCIEVVSSEPSWVVIQPLTVYWEFWADLGSRQSWEITIFASSSQVVPNRLRVHIRRVVEVVFYCLIAIWAVVHCTTLTAMHAIYIFTCFSGDFGYNVLPSPVSFSTESIWERLSLGQTLTIELSDLCSFWSLGTV